MKVIVAWDREITAGKTARTAEEVVRVVRLAMEKDWFSQGISVRPSDEQLSQQYIEFEVEDFAHGYLPARMIKNALWNSFGISTFIAVQEVDGRQFESLDEFAAHQETRSLRRYKAMQDAIRALKGTRGWFKDRRFAEIRRQLEQGL